MVKSKLNQIHGTSKKCQESCQRTIKKFYFPKQTAVPRTDFQYATYLIRKITEREEVKVVFSIDHQMNLQISYLKHLQKKILKKQSTALKAAVFLSNFVSLS